MTVGAAKTPEKTPTLVTATRDMSQAGRRVAHRELHTNYLAFVLASVVATDGPAEVWQEWYAKAEDPERLARSLCQMIKKLTFLVALANKDHDGGIDDRRKRVLDSMLADFFSPH